MAFNFTPKLKFSYLCQEHFTEWPVEVRTSWSSMAALHIAICSSCASDVMYSMSFSL